MSSGSLKSAQEKHAASATALSSDARARHDWDGGELFGRAYQLLLGLPAATCDTWTLFDRDAMWRCDRPPVQAW